MYIVLAVYLCIIIQPAFTQYPSPDWNMSLAPDESGNLSIFIDPSNDVIYLGTWSGLYTSADGGTSWTKVAAIEDPVFHIAVDGFNIYAMCSSGDFYHSHNAGETWYKSNLGTNMPATSMRVLQSGDILISTGEISNGFKGNGIFKSKDKGYSWAKSSSGIGNDKYVAQLAQDSQGRILAAVNEQFGKDGSLFYSWDDGENWIKSPKISFYEGNHLVEINLTYISALNVSQDDSIYMSMDGSFGNAAVRVSLKNSFFGALSNKAWKHMKIMQGGFSSFYNNADGVFFAKNGDIYVNRITDTPTNGSIYYSRNRGLAFKSIPLIPVVGEDTFGFYNVQYAQSKNGRIFVVQQFDQWVYHTDNSLNVITGTDQTYKRETMIFPNPVKDYVTVIFEGTLPSDISVLDLTGKTVLQINSSAIYNSIHIDMSNLNLGLYFLVIKKEGNFYKKKIVKE